MTPDKHTPSWSGRIPGGLAPEAWSFLHSLPHDRFLWGEDIAGTMAHVRGLEAAGVLRATEARRLLRELGRLAAQPDAAHDTDEDIHSAIERCLTERLGSVGAKVHAGRSRNDQVATALRLWTRESIARLWRSTLDLVEALAVRARETAETLAPGYTHMQRAQPVTVGHWLSAHAWAFVRDAERFAAAYRSADVSPLGAGALAGSTLGVDPQVAADALGFTRTFDNTIDAVSDRDFLLDAAHGCAVAATHLSRLAEEIVVWSSREFGFVVLPDAYSTGSSMMPQKKNPDVAELARAQAGPAVGSLVGLLVTLKGLPLAYDRDLQADKQNLRGTFDWAAMALQATTGLVTNLGFDPDRLEAAVADDTLLATDLAEELVGRGVPFREAHERVAHLAHEADRAGETLAWAVERLPQQVRPLGVEEALHVLVPRTSVGRRSTPGGPSPSSVRAQCRRLGREVRRSRRELARRVEAAQM